MLSYLQKLYDINQTSISIRNLRSDATRPSMFFVAYQRCKTTYARKAWTKKAKDI